MMSFEQFVFLYLCVCVFVYFTFYTRECHINLTLLKNIAHQKFSIAHVGSFHHFSEYTQAGFFQKKLDLQQTRINTRAPVRANIFCSSCPRYRMVGADAGAFGGMPGAWLSRSLTLFVFYLSFKALKVPPSILWDMQEECCSKKIFWSRCDQTIGSIDTLLQGVCRGEDFWVWSAHWWRRHVHLGLLWQVYDLHHGSEGCC